MLFSALMLSGLIGIYTNFAFSGRGIGGIPGGAPELVYVAPTLQVDMCVSVQSTCDENRLIASKVGIK
jgi:uncharacterized membrane protein AbrB (regulator of aidB expression)